MDNSRAAYGDYQTAFTVRTTQVLGGHAPQVGFMDEVIWQANPHKSREDAFTEASDYLKNKIKELFQ